MRRPYRSGSSRTWLKSKNAAREAVRREREEDWRVRPAQGHQMRELGSIDVCASTGSLGQSICDFSNTTAWAGASRRPSSNERGGGGYSANLCPPCAPERKIVAEKQRGRLLWRPTLPSR